MFARRFLFEFLPLLHLQIAYPIFDPVDRPLLSKTSIVFSVF